MLTYDNIESTPEEKIELLGIEYLEFYVGNVYQAAHFYRTAYGFKPIALSGLETGQRDYTSVVLKQNNICLVLTGALNTQNHIATHVGLHGDGVKDIALRVSDVREAFSILVKRNAIPIMEPTVIEDEDGKVIKATVGAFGDTVHSLIQRNDYKGAFLPGYKSGRDWQPINQPQLKSIDHMAVCVEMGMLNKWVDFYERVFDFCQTHQEDVETEYSAMNSRVVQNQTGTVKFPIMEPAESLRRSQIEEFLMFYGGAGVQHIAFSSDDIISSVQTLRNAGNEFLTPPITYYKMLKNRIGEISESINDLRDHNVLVDRDQWGYLMQIFTKPVESRPTLFFEVIQRKESRGFGGGNIRALFEAVEQEQARRGNL